MRTTTFAAAMVATAALFIAGAEIAIPSANASTISNDRADAPSGTATSYGVHISAVSTHSILAGWNKISNQASDKAQVVDAETGKIIKTFPLRSDNSTGRTFEVGCVPGAERIPVFVEVKFRNVNGKLSPWNKTGWVTLPAAARCVGN